ncbi:hydantoinase/oxoprolinase N-terminal domain-containing protein, partial [Acrocarpospora sp. B8E8]|uniref:hydantoinase/oxoprolinase N-terminal domain-containing protein n=1 Tax=Acrocarpospora sp. B8E8 TaxID=3153572 RepID=UPI00325EA56A
REQVGLSEAEFYPAIDRFVLGNTIVTNAVDEQKYARVGLLTTQGFRDTLRIARSARTDERDSHKLAPPPDIVDRRLIVEVPERVDAHGTVLVPLSPGAISTSVEQVLAAGAESIAVCLLWSFRNDAHERAIAGYLSEHHPDVPYSLSSALTPVYREYERMVTTALDAAVKPIVAAHFQQLADALAAKGLHRTVQIMQVHGGFLSVQETARAPISMFNSGP